MDIKPHKLTTNDYRAIANLHCNNINQGFLATLGDGRIQCTYGIGITATVIVNYGSFCEPSI